jgi:hypothetical protein
VKLRSFYRAAAVLPLVGIAVAAWLRRGTPSDLPPHWDWIYPSSITRGLVAYAIVASWLWVEIGRRPIAEIPRLTWRAPVAYVAIGWAIMSFLELLRGRAGDLWAEHAGVIVMRAAIHLILGFAYVALTHVALRALREGGGLPDAPET